MEHVAVHVGQAAVDAVVAHEEAGVVDAEEVEESGVDVVHLRHFLPVEGFVAPGVAFAGDDAALDPGAA